MCTSDEILIYLTTFEFYAMYFLMESQKDRRIEEIYYDHNAENVNEKMPRNSSITKTAQTF